MIDRYTHYTKPLRVSVFALPAAGVGTAPRLPHWGSAPRPFGPHPRWWGGHCPHPPTPPSARKEAGAELRQELP